MIKTYQNIGGNSGVAFYEAGPDYIEVWFQGSPRSYRYSYGKAGPANVEAMKVLAQNGNGLNSFINRNVKFLYD